MLEVLEFALDEFRLAVPAERVLEVSARVLVTPLPEAPPPVLGVVAYRGEPMAVVDLRARLGLPPRAPELADHFVMARAARRVVALVVDRACGLRAVHPREVRPPAVPSRHVAGIVALDDGLLLIEDLDAVLSLDEEQAIDRGLEALAAAR